MNIEKNPLNVLGKPLRPCSFDPLTGFFRNGYCQTCFEDYGIHTVCIEACEEFLYYSKIKGNDLTTPIPEHNFKGLKAGDRWCLCASRWLEAYNDHMAPKVFLESTHEETLAIIPLKILKAYAIDSNTLENHP